MGCEEHRVGWHVQDLKGKYLFLNNVIFNENLSGRLGIPHSPSYPATNSSVPPVPCSQHDIQHIRTVAGQAYDKVLRLKEN